MIRLSRLLFTFDMLYLWLKWWVCVGMCGFDEILKPYPHPHPLGTHTHDPHGLPIPTLGPKPSQHVVDILTGHGQPAIPCGVQLPTKITNSVPLPDLPDPLNTNNLAAAYLMTVVEDPDDVLCAIDLAMVMEGATTESEALEPSSLDEAHCHPD